MVDDDADEVVVGLADGADLAGPYAVDDVVHPVIVAAADPTPDVADASDIPHASDIPASDIPASDLDIVVDQDQDTETDVTDTDVIDTDEPGGPPAGHRRTVPVTG